MAEKPKKIRTLEDPVFSALTQKYGDSWERPLDIRLFGRKWKASLYVTIDPANGVEPTQILAFKTFTAKERTLLAAAELAVFEYYNGIAESLGLELLASPKELSRQVTKVEAITFPYVCPRPTFGLLGECSWEEEHGLGVKFEDGKVTEVGFQDILL